MRLRTVTYAVAVAAIFLAAGAYAQGVDRKALATAASASSAPTDQERQQIEARRKELFHKMLADPTNLDVAFEYAGLSARVGDVEAAISTLERMLIFAPGLPRLQLELGVLYYRVGAFETARAYFQQALKAPNVPDVVKARVDPYLTAIDNRTKGYTFSGSILSGVRYQTNANSGPASEITISPSYTGGIPITLRLDQTAMGGPDYNAFVSSQLDYSVDLKDQGDRFDINLVTYGAWYRKRHDIDTEYAELKLGPIFDLGRFGMKNTALGIYAIGNGVFLDEDPYLATAGAGASFVTLLSPRTRVLLQNEYRREQYINSTLRPTSSLRTGNRVTGLGSVQQQLSDRFSVFATVQGERDVTEVGYLNEWAWGGSAGWMLAFDSPNPSQAEKWKLGISGGYLRRNYDDPDLTISVAQSEWDSEKYVLGTLDVPIKNGWGIEAQSGVRKVNSNYPTRAYQNIQGSIAMSKRF